jgi:hypothetical protein
MTAATYTLRASAPPARSGFRWTLALLGVCLPVPICAMSGLSLPLPATVERIAASLVPWADGVAMSANEALRTGARGSIVADREERFENGGARPRVVKIVGTDATGGGTSVILLPGADAPSLPGTTPAVAQPQTAPGQQAGDAQPGEGGSTPSAPATPESPAPAAGPTPAPASGPTPAPPAEPTEPSQPLNSDPVAAVKPVVDEVLAPVVSVVETTKTVVEKVVPVVPALPVLPGIGK